MTKASLEHANISVSDPERTAGFLCNIFGWKVRWKGEAKDNGMTVHVGTDDNYLAVYAQNGMKPSNENSYTTIGTLNHVGVVVDDLEKIEQRVAAEGLEMGEHYDYEPGQRFYFYDHDGIEFEVVKYD